MKRKLVFLVLNVLPKKMAHKILYRISIKKKLNLKKPEDLNEKLQYLMIYKYGKKEGMYSDKFKVKDYINKMNIKDLNVPKTLKIYTSADQINLDELPEKFVLKCNHGSGKVFICQSKNNFNLNQIKIELRKMLKQDFSKQTLEYHYSFIKPLIIAEEYLDDGENTNPVDYKFYCHNGIVESILVCSERNISLRLDDYDLNWDMLDYTYDKYKSHKEITKPANLDTMIQIASELSKEFPFVRVDLYSIKGKIYFGELTFTPAAGLITYYKQSALDKLGEMIDLKQYN